MCGKLSDAERCEGGRNTGRLLLSQRMCHLSFVSTSISRDSSDKEGTCEPVLPDNFFIEYHDNLELSCYKHFMWWVKYQGKGKK